MAKIKTLQHFIERAREIHGNDYSYDEFSFIDYRTPSTIICPMHGKFEQSPNKHLSLKRGCPKCGILKRAETQKQKKSNAFKEKASKIHNNFYSYEKSIYQGAKMQIIVTCPIHGDFQITPNDHLNGHGCPKCKQSSLEKLVKSILIQENIQFEEQRRVPTDEKLKLDFYLPQYNIAIECQGEQHFKPIEHFGGNDEFEKIKDRDKRKFDACEAKNIKLIYFLPKNLNVMDNLFYQNKQITWKTDDLIQKIKNNAIYP